MLEYLIPSDPSPFLRIGSTGRLEGKGKYVSDSTYIGDGWYNLLLPEKPSSIYTMTKGKVMVVGEESGKIYTISDNLWTKLPPLYHPVVKVFCDNNATFAITSIGELFSHDRGIWLHHYSPVPLVAGYTLGFRTVVINNRGRLYVMGDVAIGVKERRNLFSITHCSVPDDEVVTNATIEISLTRSYITVVTTGSGKEWRAGGDKQGWWMY